jgi:hypothetical protein
MTETRRAPHAELVDVGGELLVQMRTTGMVKLTELAEEMAAEYLLSTQDATDALHHYLDDLVAEREGAAVVTAAGITDADAEIIGARFRADYEIGGTHGGHDLG